MTKTRQSDILAAVESERAYQDSLWKDPENSDFNNPLTVGEFLLLVDEYSARARHAWTGEIKPEIETLHIMRKIAAIAWNCMEQHGAPQREGFER